MFHRASLRPVLAAAGLLWSGPALAGEAACLWDVLSPATQDRLLASQTKAAPDGGEPALEPTEARRQMLRCAQLGGVVDPKRAVAAMNRSLNGWLVRRRAAEALRARSGPSEDQLSSAWSELGFAGRTRLRTRAETARMGPDRTVDWGDDAPLLAELLLLVDRQTGVPRSNPELQTELELYVFGRSLQEAMEPRF